LTKVFLYLNQSVSLVERRVYFFSVEVQVAIYTYTDLDIPGDPDEQMGCLRQDTTFLAFHRGQMFLGQRAATV
jgi:hypothetical protein